MKIPFVSLSIYSPISRVVSQPTSSKKNPYGRRPAFTHCSRLAVTSQASNRRLTPEGLRNPSPRDQPTLREASQYGRLAAEPPDGAWLATAPSGSSPHVPPPAQQSTRQSQDNPQDNPKHDAKWTFDSLLFERKNIYFLFLYRKPPNVHFVPCFELSCGLSCVLSCDCLAIVLGLSCEAGAGPCRARRGKDKGLYPGPPDAPRLLPRPCLARPGHCVVCGQVPGHGAAQLGMAPARVARGGVD